MQLSLHRVSEFGAGATMCRWSLARPRDHSDGSGKSRSSPVNRSPDWPLVREGTALPTMEQRKVLIVDDSPLLRSVLRAGIEATPDLRVAGEAADGQAAMQLAKQLR